MSKSNQEIEQPGEAIDVFQKKLVLHMLVMDNYTLVNRRSHRLEFHGPLTEQNIQTILNAIRDDAYEYFKIALACPDCGAKTEQEAETACHGHDTCPMTCCDDWNEALKQVWS